jgi:hypothetical protein
MVFQARVNVTMAERSALAPAAHAVVRSCRKFEEHWSI